MEENYPNCWEFKGCGREPGGKNALLYGVCPVTVDSRVDGIHNGKNGGRCCWALFSIHHKEGKQLGGCSIGFYECRTCDFYKLVRRSTQLLITAS